MTEEKIKAIYGQEPQRADEYPTAHVVGAETWTASGAKVMVTEITYREQNLGDHGIGWYDVFSNQARIASMNARAVAEVHYELGPVA